MGDYEARARELSEMWLRDPRVAEELAPWIAAALTEAHRAGIEEARGGLEYALEQFRDRGWNCDCRLSGSGGCFEQCPLHAALAEKRRE